jgi:anti-sigma B factor antagonist
MTTPGPNPAFGVAVDRQDRTLVARPAGELDLSTAPLLSGRLREHDDFDRLVLDLRSLDFMDSTGLRLLVAEQERAREGGYELAIVRGSAEVDRLLELTRMDRRLPIVDAQAAGV